jgi:hypothetical protein
MKKAAILIMLVIVSKFSFAQKNLLAFNDDQKYIYYQVDTIEGSNAAQMHPRGLESLKRSGQKILTAQSVPGSRIEGSGKVMMYYKTSLVAHETAEISYKLHMEFKDTRYRIWLTDFMYAPVQRNRYGIYAPLTGMTLPLERVAGKLSQKEVNSYLDQIGAYCQALSVKLKSDLTMAPAKPVDENKPKRISIEKW